MTPQPRATVAIPAFNGDATIGECLDAVLAQEMEFPFEVLVIDSGSTDGTLDEIRRRDVRLVEIPNHEFGHGRTRNLAVELARGDYVAFLTQDATPATRQWLRYLVGAFEASDRVGAAYGPHLPRPDADPRTRRDLTDFFAGMGPPDRPTVHRKGELTFFSDVNSCIAKAAWKEVPFRDLAYAEDQALGHDLLEAGWEKVYEPRASVIHSHSFPPVQYFRRMFDEWLGLKRAVGASYSPRLRTIAGEVRRGLRADVPFIRGLDGSSQQKAGWILLATWMSFARGLTAFLVERHERLPGWLIDRLSHERTVKRRLAKRVNHSG